MPFQLANVLLLYCVLERIIMAFFAIFKRSFAELKKLECLTATGILIAVYVILEAFVSVNVAGFFKINFAFIALAMIGMLFGPSVAMVAAIACDVIGAAMSGYPLILWYTLIAMLEGMIYGLFLYGFKPEKTAKQWVRIFFARTIVVLVVNLVLNTVANYLCGYISTEVPIFEAIILRVAKNAIELPLDLFLLYGLLSPAALIYNRLKNSHHRIRS